jgi:hypothetical protein
MNRRIAPLVENVAEASTACLITMMQGNFLAFTLTHWLIASQTGVIAGVVASVTLMLAKTDNRWLVAAVLGTVTAAVDFMVHPGSFGSIATEAIVTGAAAGTLSYLVGSLWRRFRVRFAAEIVA